MTQRPRSQRLLVPPGKRALYDYYRMDLLADGFPGAPRKGVDDDELFAHPIYGCYLIRDSLSGYRTTGNQAFLDQAVRTGAAALERMRPIGDALVFEYAADSPFNMLGRSFVSALTQARYLDVLDRLHRATSDVTWRAAAEAVLASFRVPLANGGVAVVRETGTSFEEVPHAVPSFILNGWLSVLQLVHRYSKRNGSTDACDLFTSSIPLLRQMLPRYDVPELNNSRYMLAGPVPFELRFSVGAKGHIRRPRLLLPNGDPVDFGYTDRAGKWDICLVTGKGTARTLDGLEFQGHPVNGNLVMSFETEEPTRIDLLVSVDAPARIELMVPEMRYDARLGTLMSKRMEVLASRDVHAGESRVDFELSPASFPYVAAPTTWGKRLPEGNFNGYHFMHVTALNTLHQLTGDPELGAWATRWERYASEWDAIPEYQRDDIKLARPDGM